MKKSHSQFYFWENIFQGIGCIYSAALFDCWSIFTEKVISITNSDKVSLSLINQKNEEVLLYANKTNHLLAPEVNTKSNKERSSDLSHCVRLFPGTSIPTNVLPKHCYYCQHTFFVENVAYQMLFRVSKCDQEQIYSETELTILLYLIPYLITSLTAFTTHKDSLNRLEILQQTIEQGSKGVILFNHHKKIIFVNQFMKSQLIKNDFMKVVNNNLVLTKDPERLKFNQLLHEVSRQPLAEIISMTLDDKDGGHALISIVPIRKTIISHSDIATTMVTVNFEQLMNWTLFADEYQLTKKELILLQALYKNKKLNELPKEFGVTINTLRTHLQSIFHKTETKSQIALMIRLSMYKF